MTVDPLLCYIYTKRAAELGLVEAMHNLAVIYLQGNNNVNKHSFKALSWFSRASHLGFTHSSYNAAKLFMQGADDNLIHPNYHAALHYL